MSADLTGYIGLAVAILLFVFLRRHDRRAASASRKITPLQAVLLVMGSALLILFLIMVVRDLWDKILTPI